MQVCVLVDNRAHPLNNGLKCEHGLSLWVETTHCKFVCDMGLTSSFFTNAQTMGIDWAEADFAVVSHGHVDHTGGLSHLLTSVAKMPVFITPECVDRRFYSSRHERKKDISPDVENWKPFMADRFKWVEQSGWINPQVALVRLKDKGQFDTPKGNDFLTSVKDGCEQMDDFAHEMAVVVCTDRGMNIISSCSHHGVMNIIADCAAFTGEPRLNAFVGGTHFVDAEGSETEVEQFIFQFKKNYPKAHLYTGHCTGSKAAETLSNEACVTLFHTGFCFDCDEKVE